MPPFADSHVHLADPAFDADREDVIAGARRAGAQALICIGESPDAADRARDIASAHPGFVWHTAGMHPHEASSFDLARDLDRVRAHVATGAVAIGECGLDYHYDHSPRDVQRTAFAAQIQLAHERRLPLVIHTRDAWDDTFDVLGAEGVPERTIFHCFTGGPDEARRCVDVGAFVSFSGIVTFKNATPIQEAARQVSLERILVETDSPYLAPIPHRGQPNRPAWVAFVGNFVAGLRGMVPDEMAAAVAANSRAAFPAVAS